MPPASGNHPPISPDYGNLAHCVTLPSGGTFRDPMRVIPNEEGCEVLFTVRRFPGVTDDEFTRDVGMVAADLATLKRVVEGLR